MCAVCCEVWGFSHPALNEAIRAGFAHAVDIDGDIVGAGDRVSPISRVVGAGEVVFCGYGIDGIWVFAVKLVCGKVVGIQDHAFCEGEIFGAVVPFHECVVRHEHFHDAESCDWFFGIGGGDDPVGSHDRKVGSFINLFRRRFHSSPRTAVGAWAGGGGAGSSCGAGRSRLVRGGGIGGGCSCCGAASPQHQCGAQNERQLSDLPAIHCSYVTPLAHHHYAC